MLDADAATAPRVQIHNCHLHLFTNRSVPDGFFPLRLLKLLRNQRVFRPVGRALRRLSRSAEEDQYDRLAAFAEIGNLASQSAIFDFVRGFYPADTRYVVLAMDMEFMGAGRAPMPYREQLDELAALKKEHGDTFLPFVAVDPRRARRADGRDLVDDLVRPRVEGDGFAGIKLYPPLGFYPCDPRLEPVYDYAEQLGLPIMAHCSRGGVYYRGKIGDDLLVNDCQKRRLTRAKNKVFCNHFTDPRNYAAVLRRHQELRLCLAHFGGADEWDRYLATPRIAGGPLTVDSEGRVVQSGEEVNWVSFIKNNLFQYRHVFADISFIMQDRRFIPVLKVLLEQDEKVRTRTLFGTDFYMLVRQRSERAFSFYNRAELGEPLFRQIAEANPKRYLEKVLPTA